MPLWVMNKARSFISVLLCEKLFLDMSGFLDEAITIGPGVIVNSKTFEHPEGLARHN